MIIFNCSRYKDYRIYDFHYSRKMLFFYGYFSCNITHILEGTFCILSVGTKFLFLYTLGARTCMHS